MRVERPGAGIAPRVVIALPCWSFFASSASDDLIIDRRRLADSLSTVLAQDADVIATVVAGSEADWARFAEAASRADCAVIAPTMAAPPAPVLAALDRLPGLPLVLWAARADGPMPHAITHSEITMIGATVGTPQISSLLVRQGRPFDLVIGAATDQAACDRVRRAVRAAAVAGRLRRSRIGRIGTPIEGYACVDADAPRLAAEVGPRLVSIEPGEFAERFERVPRSQVGTAVESILARYRLARGVGPAALERAVRCTVALNHLVAHHDLDAGAFNCHTDEIRYTRVGLAPCLALGESTSAGVPWTCTGDVLTAVAMLTTKLLCGASLYHELEMYDEQTGEFVLANSGEHDAALCSTGTVPLIDHSPWWPEPASLCARLSPDPGPATLVAFAQQAARHRFVVGPGRFTARMFEETGTANAAFRFETTPATAAWIAWCRAGANHHASAAPGELGPALLRVAEHLRIDCTVV